MPRLTSGCRGSLREEGGLLQESFIEEPDGLVSVNLLVLSAVSAFATGAVLSGLAVCWIMGHKHRSRSRSGAARGSRGKGDKEQSMLGQGGSGSVVSVSRAGEGGGGGRGGRAQAETLFDMPNGWARGELDLLPTPEQTPLQQKRPPPGLRLGDTSWDQSQTFLNSNSQNTPSSTVIYLSSKLLQGRREEPGDPGQPAERQHYLSLAAHHRGEGQGGGGRALRNSAGEYAYPATPQESPDRRRAVSAPNPQMDFGEPTLRWGPEGYNFNSNNGAPSPALCHYPAPRGPHHPAWPGPGSTGPPGG
ncbi:hypothetical protein COCON_G00059740 [Conger conger]|uniref:Uncharacterized protein n=1 Tax=Conger conger TaxID=82655 RepID=A0A9Q1DR06_CONCO|nr:hypothetical protein COCON_G00059740 [Conger conger]